ncbi:helix-turn-helix domain-containing protein [Porphyromonas sp. COT-108 OH2963]|uniref:helix-turn-helix domain-containing protein n=1 Tax=Porphyromonas sp. COT-108 OH2963 TaxID=1515614 RepID=UPI00068BC286|nr:helix-turn-helix transcriptional regulator [Porphyromonas sp. COT-108 OH2963]
MDNIETLLRERGLTKTALAELLGIKKQNLNNLMKNPTLETIKKFASVLEVQPYDLFKKKETQIYGYLELDGEVRKVSSISDLENILKTAKKV